MNLTDATDLAVLHEAITATSAAAFPGVHFEFYREDRVNLPFGDGAQGNEPRAYCMLDMSEMDASEFDPGTDQQEVMAKFEAEFIIKSLQGDSCLLIRVLAGSYAAFLRRQFRWPGTINGKISVTGVYKDDFRPELDQFEVWKVEWVQTIRLGEGVDVFVVPAIQTDSGNPELTPGVPALAARPSSVLYSFVPLVGIPYEDRYTEAMPAALP